MSLRFVRLPLVAAALAFTAACENPVQPEEHPEAGGVVILDAGTGTALATAIGENADFDTPITLTASQVLEVEVKFLDADAPDDLTRAYFPHEDEGESLRATVTNEAIVTYADQGEHGDLTAHSVGQTTVRFELMHGGHPDFGSGLLTVIVQ